ncbi:MAG: urease accessory protein UreE [Cyanobacteria bacterium J06641_5]
MVSIALTFTQRLPAPRDRKCIDGKQFIGELALDAEARGRSRGRYRIKGSGSERDILLQLPRGTILTDGDLLAATSGEFLQVRAQPEPVAIVRAEDPLVLLRAAYHLGNRHVPLEVRVDCLMLAADPVLEQMAIQLGATVDAALAPFHPERGAYRHHLH